jgi:hypothetical protein
LHQSALLLPDGAVARPGELFDRDEAARVEMVNFAYRIGMRLWNCK